MDGLFFFGQSAGITGLLITFFPPIAVMLKIALPNKGRLADEARALFAEAGLEVRARSDRALTASLGGEFKALFVRAQDIPEFVADGAADAGITGVDLVRESERELDDLLDLGFGKCRMVVAVKDESGIKSIEDISGSPRIATVFPRVTRRFFGQVGRQVDVVPVSGAAEIAPHLGIADIVVDLTETGSTLRVNGLREVTTIFSSSARLIAAHARDLGTEKNTALAELVAALGSVTRARGKRYLMANVPREKLDLVREIIPGINGPTVIDILGGGDRVAVHAVVPADAVYRTIARLKALGGEGILVTRIERLMP
ncbi:MAG: ATP phosphoribosyltransferase [Chloroflexota bacterium]